MDRDEEIRARIISYGGPLLKREKAIFLACQDDLHAPALESRLKFACDVENEVLLMEAGGTACPFVVSAMTGIEYHDIESIRPAWIAIWAFALPGGWRRR